MNMFSKSHEDIMNYIYTMLDYFSMLNLINSHPSIAHNIHFNMLKTIEIDETINTSNEYTICKFIKDNPKRKNQLNIYLHKCRIKFLFVKYHLTTVDINNNKGIILLKQILEEPKIYSKTTLNEILLRTIPNNNYENRNDDINTLHTFGTDIKQIPWHIFTNNNLTNITIPNFIIYIGMYSFMNNQLTDITISNSVTAIGLGAFMNNKLTNIIIPDSVNIIYHNAFRNNKLTNIIIPKSVINIARYAFFDNPELKTVTIPSIFKDELTDFFNNEHYVEFIYI